MAEQKFLGIEGTRILVDQINSKDDLYVVNADDPVLYVATDGTNEESLKGYLSLTGRNHIKIRVNGVGLSIDPFNLVKDTNKYVEFFLQIKVDSGVPTHIEILPIGELAVWFGLVSGHCGALVRYNYIEGITWGDLLVKESPLLYPSENFVSIPVVVVNEWDTNTSGIDLLVQSHPYLKNGDDTYNEDLAKEFISKPVILKNVAFDVTGLRLEYSAGNGITLLPAQGIYCFYWDGTFYGSNGIMAPFNSLNIFETDVWRPISSEITAEDVQAKFNS